jgi:hypothetical protein
MALLTTCSAANRIIDQALSTEWTRTLVTSLDNAVEGFYANYNFDFSTTWKTQKIYLADHPYWRYDIKRTMSYHYFGLGRSYADAAAHYFTYLLNLPRYPLSFYKGDTEKTSCWQAWFNSASGSSASDTWPSSWKGISNCRGSAVASPDHDDAWQVDVSISEDWTIPYLTTGTYAKGNYVMGCWVEFENEPNRVLRESQKSADAGNAWNFFIGDRNNTMKYIFEADDVAMSNYIGTSAIKSST